MIAAFVTVIALAAWLALCARNVRIERHRRDALFADCMELFGACRVTRDGIQLPVLDGKYRGLPVRLEPVLDDIGVRKIPSLWLKATLLVDNPRRGVLDFLVRPQGIEVYSPSHDLPRHLQIPTGWPQHAILCTDRVGLVPPIETLTSHIRAFDDARMKELLITPRGVRLVYQAAQAERAEYLVLRQARFAQARLDPALVRALLDRVIAIAADLDTSAVKAQVA